MDIRTGVNAEKRFSFYSVINDFDNDFLSMTYYVDAEVDFLTSWSLGSLFEYSVFSGSAFTGNKQLPLWSARLSKYFLKNDRGELKLLAFDILGQNKIINRTSHLNYYQDEDGSALGSFYLVSFIYNLSKLQGKS